MSKRIGRYNVEIMGYISKFNTYINDYGNTFIYFEGDYIQIEKKERYRGGWLWQLKKGDD
jgi:hypothetical protein